MFQLQSALNFLRKRYQRDSFRGTDIRHSLRRLEVATSKATISTMKDTISRMSVLLRARRIWLAIRVQLTSWESRLVLFNSGHVEIGEVRWIYIGKMILLGKSHWHNIDGSLCIKHTAWCGTCSPVAMTNCIKKLRSFTK